MTKKDERSAEIPMTINQNFRKIQYIRKAINDD